MSGRLPSSTVQATVSPFLSGGAVEALLQARPAVEVVVLRVRGSCRVFGQMLREARLEHEGHGPGELVGLEVDHARLSKGVWPV